MASEIRDLAGQRIDQVDLFGTRLHGAFLAGTKVTDAHATDVAGIQRAWATVQEIAATTLDTARRLPPELLDASVDGEFSYLQTLRHLVFAIDRWITGPVLGDDQRFHPLGYP